MNKADLEALCDALKTKALHEQMLRRRYQQRVQDLEAIIAVYEGGNQ